MTKIRVHELAKQMNLTTKEILGFLGSGFSVQSGLTEDQVAFVKAKAEEQVKSKSLEKKAVLVKANKPKDADKAAEEGEKKEEAKSAEKPSETPDEAKDAQKKKKPVFLFRPENSRTSS